MFEQTLNELEYIFVDDASSDNSLEILNNVIADYPNRQPFIHIIREAHNQGVSAARNKGLNTAKGIFVAFCDSDDWVSLDMYEQLYAKALAKCADIVYCDFYMYFSESEVKLYETNRNDKNRIYFLRGYMSSYTTLCNLIAKRDLYTKYGLYFPTYIAYREDFHLSIRLYYYANSIEKIEKGLYFYNRINTNSSLHIRRDNHENDELICDLEIIHFFKENKVLKYFNDKLSWMVLRDKQEMLFDNNLHKQFLAIYPESHKYIWNCPLINIKVKFMMWALCSNIGLVTKTFNLFRKIHHK